MFFIRRIGVGGKVFKEYLQVTVPIAFLFY